MKVQYVDTVGTPLKLSIKRAVENFVENNESGVVENAQRTADDTAELLGRLIQLLHEKNMLTDDEVLETLLLGTFMKTPE